MPATARPLPSAGKNNSRQKDLLKKRKMLFDLETETSADTSNIVTDEEYESYFRPRDKNVKEGEEKETLPPKSKKKCIDKSDDDNESSEEGLSNRGDLRIITFQLPETASSEEVFEKKKSNDVMGIDHHCSNLALIGLNLGTTGIKIHGCAWLSALKGKFSINGYEFQTGVAAKVYAPMSHCASVLIPTSAGSNEDLKSRWGGKQFVDMANYDVVILIDSSDSAGLLNCLPGYPNLFNVKLGDVEDSAQICKGLWSCKTDWYFTEHPCYKEVSNDIVQCVVESKKQQTVLTAGGKNAGKSSFNRYLVNKLLAVTSTVYYLECDIGQTEFTPSGMVSLYKVTTPMLGPPFTHQDTPLLSCYLGYASPSCDPDRYIQCLQYLVQRIRQCCNDGPIVVNTMGWNRALGLQLLVDTIRYTNPTHIVQFETSRESRNIPPLTNEYLSTGRGWMTHTDDEYEISSQLKILTVDNTLPNVIKYKAPDLRHLAILSYMCSAISEQQLSTVFGNVKSFKTTGMLSALQSCRPYCVELKHVRVCNATENVVKNKQVLQAINAAVVGLCVDNSLPKGKESENPEDYLQPLNVCPCLGVAIVRGVDVEKGLIYILSHLPFEVITNVNCIVLGSQSVPDTLLLQSAKTGPYKTTNYPYETVGAGRFRTHRKFSKIRDNPNNNNNANKTAVG